jgi:hypothetical protein
MAKQPKPASKPLWREKLGELSFHGQVLRRFAYAAPRPVCLLRAFQRAGWQTSIPNPFLPEGHRSAADILNDTLRNLNRDLPLIHFSCGEKGKFVSWHFRPGTHKYTRI